MILVVPGIRTEEKKFNNKDDQKRTLSPKEAINLGADFLVIGRPIIEYLAHFSPPSTDSKR